MRHILLQSQDALVSINREGAKPLDLIGGANDMLPAIYTTYGAAMGHRPEVLAESGGLRPAGAERTHEPAAWVRGARVRGWLNTILVRVRPWHQTVEGQVTGDEATISLALPSSH